MVHEYVLPFSELSFSLSWCSPLLWTKFLILPQSLLVNFGFGACVFDVISTNQLAIGNHWSKVIKIYFYVLFLNHWSILSFFFHIACGHTEFYCFPCGYLDVPAIFVETRLCFPTAWSWHSSESIHQWCLGLFLDTQFYTLV